MVLTVQRRRHSRWRMFITCVVLLSFVKYCELTPTGKLKDPETPSISLAGRSRMRKSQDIGSPSELAWQAWLLLDTQSGAHSSLDSASLLRRITPKSVFIAPALTACPDGYQADKMGRCVRNFNIDEKAHTSFLLQRLNVKFADSGSFAGGSSSLNNDQKHSSGPLQLNIPLLSNMESQSVKIDHEETRDSMEVPVVVPPQGDRIHADEKKKPQEAVVTVYDVKNDTATKEDENVFFLGNTSTCVSCVTDQSSSSKPDSVVPVAEFVEDTNKTDFSEVVDYKIPIALKTIFNASSIKKINITGEADTPDNSSDNINSTDDSPKLVLLLSPTKLPSKVQISNEEDTDFITKDETEPVIIHMANLTSDISDKDIISVSVPESSMPPLKKLSDIPLLVVDKTENDTLDEAALDDHVLNNPQDKEPLYDDEDEEEEEEEDEDYLDSTDQPLYEESGEGEGDEILKHSEAGITIPVKNLERFHLEKKHQQIQPLKETSKNETVKTDIPNETFINFNESSMTDKDEKEEAGTNVSSEVSITGDFIHETTILNVNTAKPRNNTKRPETNETPITQKAHEAPKEIHQSEKESNQEPEVVFSPQNVHGTVSTRLHGGKRTDQAKTDFQSAENLQSDELEAAPSSSETLLYDPHSNNQYREEDAITEIHTIDTQYSINKETLPDNSESNKSIKSEDLPKGNVKSLASDFRPTHGYSDLPNYVRQSMRLYSEEANSIHNQDYKERIPYRLDDGLHSSTKSSVHIHQKPSYLFMPSWRSDRQQISAQQAQTTATSPRQKHPPVFLHFWTHMPLMVDPSLSSSGQESRGDSIAGARYPNSKYLQASPSRRTNFYKDVSPQDLSMSFAQKLRTLIGG